MIVALVLKSQIRFGITYPLSTQDNRTNIIFSFERKVTSPFSISIQIFKRKTQKYVIIPEISLVLLGCHGKYGELAGHLLALLPLGGGQADQQQHKQVHCGDIPGLGGFTESEKMLLNKK